MDQVLALIREWKVERMGLSKFTTILGSSSSPKILKGIKEVLFPHLQFINLPFNDVESIEEVDRIYLPALK